MNHPCLVFFEFNIALFFNYEVEKLKTEHIAPKEHEICLLKYMQIPELKQFHLCIA